MASKLRSPDVSSLLYAVFRKQKHLAGVGDVRAEENIHRADRQIRRFAFRTVEFADRECRTSNSKIWCVDLSDRTVQNEDSEYRPSTALIWRADRHVRRLALMTVEFDHWECRASNSMLSTVDRQAPTILAWRIKVLWTSFLLSREICCSVKAVSDA